MAEKPRDEWSPNQLSYWNVRRVSLGRKAFPDHPNLLACSGREGVILRCQVWCVGRVTGVCGCLTGSILPVQTNSTDWSLIRGRCNSTKADVILGPGKLPPDRPQ